jgi:Restriction endonuclease
MATERKKMSTTTRKQVIARDSHTCQKCGKKHKKLNIHHINPIALGQDDSPENLVILCKHCHSEWEHIVYAKTDQVIFENWLAIPPASELIAMFSQGQHWTDDISAKDARNMIIQGFQFIKDCRQFELPQE